jgi:hypothetical protein
MHVASFHRVFESLNACNSCMKYLEFQITSGTPGSNAKDKSVYCRASKILPQSQVCHLNFHFEVLAKD